MSLIADALKTAQQERIALSEQTAAQARAASGFLAYRKRETGTSSTRTALLAGLAATVVIAAGLVLYVRAPKALPAPAAPTLVRTAASEPASPAPVVPTPGADSLTARAAAADFERRSGYGLPPEASPFDVSGPPRQVASMPPAIATPAPAAVTPPTGVAAVPAAGEPSAAVATDSTPTPAPARPGTLRITVEGGAAPSRPTNTLAQQAADAQRRGDFAHARSLYEQAIARGDVSAELYNNYASLQRATGSLAGAVASYRAAIALDSRNAVAWSNLGVVFDGLGQRGDATASFQQALRLDPLNAATKLNLALQFRAVGALDEARRMLDEVVLSAPQMAEGHYARGQVLEDQGDRAAALREYALFLRTAGTRLPAASEQVRHHIVQLGGSPP